MENFVILQFMLFSILWVLKAKTNASLSWPIASSTIKLLGLFPQYSDNESKNNPWILHCRAMFRAAILLSQQYNITFQGHYLSYEEILTNDDITITFNQTCQKVSTANIVGFVGPAYSNEARCVASFAYRLGILSVSYLATSPGLTIIDTGAFYRVAPSDEKIILGIKILFQQYKWKSCIIVYQNDEYGFSGMQLLSQKLSEIHIKIFETIKFGINQQNYPNDFKTILLHTLSRIVIVWANDISTRAILNKALEDNLMDQDFTWILTTTVTLESFNQSQQQKLMGILAIQPAHGDLTNAKINTTLLNEAYKLWKFYEYDTFPGDVNVSIYALFTFDATWSLILSLQQLCSTQLSCLEFINDTDCYNRRFVNSEQYYNIMKTMTFLGVSGELKFSKGTLDRTCSINYVIKNIQFLNTLENSVDYIPVLKWNVNSTKWTQYTNQSSDILWPNRSKTIPVDHKSIQNQELRIAIIESPPSIILNNRTATYSDMIDDYKRISLTEFDGFYKDLLLYLQDRMGFIPVIMLAKPTIRYEELIVGVANDTFDIVMSSIHINAKRNQIVDFSVAIMPGSYRIVIRKVKSIQTDYLFLLEPFLWILWLLLLTIIPCVNLLIWFVEQKNTYFENENQIFGILTVISYSIYSQFSKSHRKVKTNAGRFLSSILFILQMIILSAAYITLLIPCFMKQNTKLDISGIEDIKNGKIPSNRIGILVGAQVEEYYLNYISQGKKDYYRLKSSDDIYRHLVKGDIDAAIWSNISITYHVNNIYCDLMTVGPEFSHGFYQLPVKPDWLYTPDLNLNILSFVESEEVGRVSAKWFGQRNCLKTKLFNAETKAVPITIISRLFITFPLIIIISIIVHFWSRNDFMNIICRKYRKDCTSTPMLTTSQFVLIDLSTRLTGLASVMLDTLCSLTNESILNFENSSEFDFDKLPKKTIILFISSEFASSLKIKSEQIERIFILESDKNKVNYQERFATGEDLICQLVDEICRCYENEAQVYLKSGDLKTAKLKQDQASRIHQELKTIHSRFFSGNTNIDTRISTVVRVIWLTSTLQHNAEAEKVRNLFSAVVSSFSVLKTVSDCCKQLLECEVIDNIFLIIDTDYQNLDMTDFQQFLNIKIITEYGQSTLENKTITGNYQDLISQLIHQLITHYNKLGTDYSAKNDTKTAKEMFIKAYKLCNIFLNLK